MSIKSTSTYLPIQFSYGVGPDFPIPTQHTKEEKGKGGYK